MPPRPFAPPSERETDSPMAIPGLRRSAAVLARAVRLRCPHCGRGRALASWKQLRDRCSVCGLRFHRGDAEYYSSGSVFMNLAIAEGLFAIGFVAILLVTWPNVPWDALTYGSMAAMVALPVLLYPVSKVLWLAFDILLRPVTREELAG